MSEPSTAWGTQEVVGTEKEPLMDQVFTYTKGHDANAALTPSNVRLKIKPFWFAAPLCVYLFVLAFLSSGQQHMDWSFNVSAWAVLTSFGQLFTTLGCAYYWKKLSVGGPHPNRVEILVLSTTSALLFFKMSLDVFFLQSYASLYDTQSGLATFAQRQFDAFFGLINIAFVTILPYSLYFSIQQYKTIGSGKSD